MRYRIKKMKRKEKRVLDLKILKDKKDKFRTESKDNRKSITARLNPDDLPTFNQRLKLYGYDSLNALVHEFIKGKYPLITEDRQIDNLLSNSQSNGLKSLLEGGNSHDFYQRADTIDMFNYYLNVRKFHQKTCRDLISYFRKFKDQFITERAEEIRTLSPRIRSKIMDAFRKFGQYYFYKYNNDQCQDLVAKII